MNTAIFSTGISDTLVVTPPRTGVWIEDSRVSFPEIWIDDTVFDNDTALIGAVVDYVNAMHDAFVMGGEYPIEARQSYHLDYYVTQVDNGGFWQYAHNSQLKPGPLGDCREALRHIGLEDQARIFDDFLTAMSVPEIRKAFDNGADYDLPHERLKGFDGRAITSANAMWLRSLPMVRRLSTPEISSRLGQLTSHAMYAPRKAAAEEARKAHLRTDPTHIAAVACCKAVGVDFLHLNAGVPFEKDGKTGVTWGVQTSGGFRYLTVVTGSHAVLLDKTARERLATYVFGEPKAKRIRPVMDGIWNIMRITGFGLLAAWILWRLATTYGVFFR